MVNAVIPSGRRMQNDTPRVQRYIGSPLFSDVLSRRGPFGPVPMWWVTSTCLRLSLNDNRSLNRSHVNRMTSLSSSD